MARGYRLIFAWACLGALAAAWTACAAYRRSNRRLAQEELGILFYSDLGPASIDVSAYPPDQRRNYQTYARLCSQCHTLARSNYSPVVSGEFWEMYIMAMRARGAYAAATPVTMEDAKAIRDFLEYDSQARKEGRKEEFDRQTRDLKARFNEAIDERLRRRGAPMRKG